MWKGPNGQKWTQGAHFWPKFPKLAFYRFVLLKCTKVYKGILSVCKIPVQLYMFRRLHDYLTGSHIKTTHHKAEIFFMLPRGIKYRHAFFILVSIFCRFTVNANFLGSNTTLSWFVTFFQNYPILVITINKKVYIFVNLIYYGKL